MTTYDPSWLGGSREAAKATIAALRGTKSPKPVATITVGLTKAQYDKARVRVERATRRK